MSSFFFYAGFNNMIEDELKKDTTTNNLMERVDGILELLHLGE